MDDVCVINSFLDPSTTEWALIESKGVVLAWGIPWESCTVCGGHIVLTCVGGMKRSRVGVVSVCV